MKIKAIHARQILDSKGTPTVEVDLTLENGISVRSAVPSGASTGTAEAFELRDNDASDYKGKSVKKAVTNVNTILAEALKGKETTDQQGIDNLMIDLDSTPNKSHLGANAILGISMAVTKAAAASENMPTYAYIGKLFGNTTFHMPRPMMLLIEGGKHGNWSTDIQEYMIMPHMNKFDSFSAAMEAGSSIFFSLEQILNEKGYATGVGFEGGFCPSEISSNEEALDMLVQAIEKSHFQPGDDFSLAIDGAASEFFDGTQYVLKSEGGKVYTPREWGDKVIEWTKKYPLVSLEDMQSEELWDEWTYLTEKLGTTHQIVGDDLVTTNISRIKKAIDVKAINSVLIKPNQIGTVTETMDAVRMSRNAGFTSIVSHRGDETNDDFIADFVVGTGSVECKFGGPDRGERIAKYNQLLRIEEELA